MQPRPLSKEIVIVGGARTPFGSFGGALKDLSATDLAVHSSKAALARAGVSASDVHHVIMGNAQQTSADALYLARHVGLKSGVPKEVPAITLNRLCGSGFQAVVSGAEQILLDEAEVVLAGGTESMSQAPHVIRGGRWGLGFGQTQGVFGDSLFEALSDSYTGTPMAITAENLAEQYGISRADCDQHAYSSQQRCAKAIEAGFFNGEIAPIEVQGRKGVTVVSADEHPRPATTLEQLAKLKPVFKKDGTVTAGTASGINDGAASLVVTSGDYARRNGLKPLGRLISWGIAGCDPSIMGIGPVPACQQALARAGLTLAEMDLVEINEAFAAQYLAVEKALGLDRARTNVHGSAIALGHPLAASGARITLTLLYALAATGGRYALGSACIGGGQGIAVIVERL